MAEKTVFNNADYLLKNKTYGGVRGFLTALGAVLSGKAQEAALERKKEKDISATSENVYGLAFGGILGFIAAAGLVFNSHNGNKKESSVLRRSPMKQKQNEFAASQSKSSVNAPYLQQSYRPDFYAQRINLLRMIVFQMRDKGMSQKQMISYLRRREEVLRGLATQEGMSLERKLALKRAQFWAQYGQTLLTPRKITFQLPMEKANRERQNAQWQRMRKLPKPLGVGYGDYARVLIVAGKEHTR